MAKFLSSAISLFSKPSDPNTVKEVGSSKFSSWPVRRREECLVLYGPCKDQERKASLTSPEKQAVSFNKESQVVEREEDRELYELVVQSDRSLKTSFSLFRKGYFKTRWFHILISPIGVV